ncbi:MAG: flagellar basal body rod protein [Burkholderiales bacterium PBB4]|nr:MAG: flagellar basal body rod protein [Burkholderiales bacterium PBB4]
MANLSTIARSGMQAAQTQLQASAGNVANLSTPAYRRVEVQQIAQSGGGVQTETRRSGTEGAALEADVVNQLQAKNSFLANLAVFKASNQMAGVLLNEEA